MGRREEGDPKQGCSKLATGNVGRPSLLPRIRAGPRSAAICSAQTFSAAFSGSFSHVPKPLPPMLAFPATLWTSFSLSLCFSPFSNFGVCDYEHILTHLALSLPHNTRFFSWPTISSRRKGSSPLITTQIQSVGPFEAADFVSACPTQFTSVKKTYKQKQMLK